MASNVYNLKKNVKETTLSVSEKCEIKNFSNYGEVAARSQLGMYLQTPKSLVFWHALHHLSFNQLSAPSPYCLFYLIKDVVVEPFV